MTEALFLDSLEIRNFRAFEHLRIERLGRVNLVVGKNNVGKSSLLEALWLFAYQGHPSIVWKILEARDEGRGPENTRPLLIPGPREEIGIEDYVDSIKQLFHRASSNNQEYTAQIGPRDLANGTLIIGLSERSDVQTRQRVPVLKTQFSKRTLYFDVNVGSYRLREGQHQRCVMVSANGLGNQAMEEFWDSIALTNLEDDVLKALRLIADDIQRINLLTNRKRQNARIPIVKVAGLSTPIPLRSLGEGMNRMFGIVLALVSAKDGVLLIDEIESGLHYSVQSQVWHLVFEVARRLNIQVFATTHSWDCLTAFQEAAKAYEKEEGVLIRLVEKKGRIVADLFDEDELSVVAREGIEVR